MVVSGGENVYPAEIEAVLQQHEAVVEAAVVGVPDERWGEVCSAFVVCRAPVADDELRQFCRARLASFKVPKSFRFVDELPRNAVGKVVKDELARAAVSAMTEVVTSAAGRPLSQRGLDTRRRLLDAAEQVFSEYGYHDASIVKLTETAGVAQGTFYLYFDSKKTIFDELVRDLNSRVRHAMKEGSSQGGTRVEQELLGFKEFFRFTAEHPALYRIIRQAEFVSPEMLQYHYERLSQGYIDALKAAVDAGEIGALDPEVTAWALMGLGELIGLRWILWNGGTEVPDERLRRARPHHRLDPRAEGVRRVGLHATASYLPERWLTAAEIADRSGIPEAVLVDKFGLRGKHVAAEDEHVSDLAVQAAERLFAETGVDPGSIDAVVYFGSMWKDWGVWQAAPWIAHRLGCERAFAIEYDNVSHGSPMALRIVRDVLRAEPELQRVLMVAACRESYLLDYGNPRSRFMFNFGDGAVAALVVGEPERNEVLGAHAITDGSLLARRQAGAWRVG